MLEFLNYQIDLQIDFTYKDLFNVDRLASFKDEDMTLLREGIKSGLINVSKYLIADNIERSYLLDVLEENRKKVYMIVSKMKNYHQESEYLITPFLYILNQINPDFIANYDGNDVDKIKIGFRFDKSNAFTRIYFSDSKIALNSTNDNIENIMDTLCINDCQLFVVGIENELSKFQSIVAYKLNAYPEILKIREKTREDFRICISDIRKQK